MAKTLTNILSQFAPGGKMWDTPNYRSRKEAGRMTEMDKYLGEGSQGLIPDAWQGDSLLGGPTWFTLGGGDEFYGLTPEEEAGMGNAMSPDEVEILRAAYSNSTPKKENTITPREFAKVFDPTSTEDVKKMQGMLGVKTDGILGPKTFKKLRELQGVPVGEPAEEVMSTGELRARFPKHSSVIPLETNSEYIDRHTPLEDLPELSDEELYGEDEEADILNQAWLKSAQMKRDRRNAHVDDVYEPFENEQMDMYDVDGRLIQGQGVAKGYGEQSPYTNTDIFDRSIRNMMGDPGTLYSADLSAPGGMAFQGVSPYDERFMASESESRDRLAQLIKQALNVAGR
jgi:hypothetical protein